MVHISINTNIGITSDMDGWTWRDDEFANLIRK